MRQCLRSTHSCACLNPRLRKSVFRIATCATTVAHDGVKLDAEHKSVWRQKNKTPPRCWTQPLPIRTVLGTWQRCESSFPYAPFVVPSCLLLLTDSVSWYLQPFCWSSAIVEPGVLASFFPLLLTSLIFDPVHQVLPLLRTSSIDHQRRPHDVCFCVGVYLRARHSLLSLVISSHVCQPIFPNRMRSTR